MPNWCMNNLTVSHPDPAKLQEFVDAYNSGNTCEHYLPTPKDDNGDVIKDEDSPNYWYVWNINNWGTKWDFGKSEHDDPITIENGEVAVSVDTAWSPPIQFLEHLTELGYNVRCSYWEPGMAFCGIWDNGNDNYIEYSGSDKAEEAIPVALWNEFGMSEFFEDEPEEV